MRQEEEERERLLGGGLRLLGDGRGLLLPWEGADGGEEKARDGEDGWRRRGGEESGLEGKEIGRASCRERVSQRV